MDTMEHSVLLMIRIHIKIASIPLTLSKPQRITKQYDIYSNVLIHCSVVPASKLLELAIT